MNKDNNSIVIQDEALFEKHKDYKIEFVIDQLIKQGGINIIGAERGTGKTRSCVQIAYSIIFEANDFIGYKCNKFGDVLFVNLELPEEDFKTILEPCKTYFENHGYRAKHKLSVVSYMDNLNMNFDSLRSCINDYKPFLIIIDGFKAIANLYCNNKGLQEIKNHHIVEFIKTLNEWKSTSTGSTILLTNHTNKGTTKENTHGDLLYGPGALLDFSDQAHLIRKATNENERLLINIKSRFSEDSVNSTNLFNLNSDDISKTFWLNLVEADVNESDHRTKEKYKYPIEKKQEAQKLFELNYSLSEIAEIVIGNKNSKGTICKWKKNNWV